ncbi:lipase maturation factor family protein [Candidatus Binatia bacterium]|nr:lipase maturation factor family protein [Candidatus Binatia bacterium]
MRTRALFLRGVGLVYLVAFLSLHAQVLGLYGHDGLLPSTAYLDRARNVLGTDAPWQVPTLFWLDASDAMLRTVCAVGAVSALLLVAGIAPLFTTSTCWLLYLSLCGIGQLFLGYQWDALLLETGILAVLWSPLAWRLGADGVREPSRIVLWLVRWLLFRLMFASGFVKLASGDPTWWSLTALTVHYQTQPLPSWTAWYANLLPLWLQKLSCGVMFLIELGLPFLIVLGRRARVIAFAGFVALQLGITATGNYGFFNLLTIVLCIPLLDDDMLPRVRLPERGRGAPRGRVLGGPARVRAVVHTAAAVVLVLLSAPLLLAQLTGLSPASVPGVAPLVRALAPLRLTSTYGLFAVMTTTRPELTIEGTVDGIEWRPYVFRWKPGPLDRRPPIVGLGMPRLDWQMWFDALHVQRMLASGGRSGSLITPLLLARLRERSPAVLALLDGDPFDGTPPTALRWRLDEYRFTDRAERTATGDWWQRTLLHEEPAR